jgi:ABC-type proline/glycine betaine transport system permease subunit
MVSLSFFFFFMIGIFALIGSLRGWAKEMMVTFSVVLSIFVVSILDALLPGIMAGFTKSGAF